MSHTLDNTRGDGRPNQRRRTRKDLLQAAARLMKTGRTRLNALAPECCPVRRSGPSVDQAGPVGDRRDEWSMLKHA